MSCVCVHGRPLAVLTRCFVPLFLLFWASSPGAAARCRPEQSAALLRLKQGFTSSLGSNNSSSASAPPLSSWREGTDCCRGWAGVACEEASGRVIALDLSHSFVSGEIDPALFNLTSLRSLNLSCNTLAFPSAGFEMLSNLTHLNLSDSGFAGQIPAGISRLRALISLDLSAYGLCSSSSLSLQKTGLKRLLGGLADLRELYLDRVDISAAGDEWGEALSSSVPNLHELSLSGCSLSGPIHPSFFNLTSLTFLRLDQNNLSTALPEFLGKLASLRFLRLSSCGLHGQLPRGIFALPHLRTLDISNNPMLSGRLSDFSAGSVLENLLLFQTNLSGDLPDSIGMLESLKTLSLANCNFSGSLPPSFGNLARLVTVDLSINNFSGPIPSFAAAVNLSKLDLQNNSLTGPVHGWLFGLPSLKTLQLNSNELSGELGDFDTGSPPLETVDLSSNKLKGSIPRSISTLRSVKVFRLASNRLNGTVRLLDLFGNLRNLSILDLSGNMLSVEIDSSSVSFPGVSTLNLASCKLSEFPDFLRGQSQISRLDLSDNGIGGIIPDWLWSVGAGTLVYLNLSRNGLTGFESPPHFSNSSLIVLDLHSNNLTGSIPHPPPSNLVVDYSDNQFTSALPPDVGSSILFTIFFSASGNRLTGEIPNSICRGGYLQVLDLSSNNLGGKIPACLLSGENELRVLNLGGNSLNGSLPAQTGESCKLRSLDLNGNRLGGTVPQFLSSCTMLQVLDLGNNLMEGPFPWWLGKLRDLRVLVLRSNRFAGRLPTNKSGNYTFSMLQILDISSNFFSGPLPSACFQGWKAMTAADEQPGVHVSSFDFLVLSHLYYQDSVAVTVKGMAMTLTKILTIFTSVDLSNNKFSGSIPEAVGQLRALRLLNVSYNALTGGIPSSIGELVVLESLDLSSNRLSGSIPPGLAALNFLSVLNLSNNDLVGRIPQGRQIITFTVASFAGNEHLCGLPLSNQCPDGAAAGAPSSQAPNSVLALDWEYIFLGLGFGGGLALVLGPFLVWSEGRRWYNKHVDRFLSAVVPTGPWVCGGWQDVKVDAEEKAEHGEEEDDDPRRRFCVFCTRLEVRGGRAFIRHADCTCGAGERR